MEIREYVKFRHNNPTKENTTAEEELFLIVLSIEKKNSN